MGLFGKSQEILASGAGGKPEKDAAEKSGRRYEVAGGTGAQQLRQMIRQDADHLSNELDIIMLNLRTAAGDTDSLGFQNPSSVLELVRKFKEDLKGYMDSDKSRYKS